MKQNKKDSKKEKIVDKMIKENEIGIDDRPVGLFLFNLFEKGPIKMSKTKDKDEKRWFNNLKKNKYFEGDKIVVDEGFEKNDVGFILMILVARGLIKRSK